MNSMEMTEIINPTTDIESSGNDENYVNDADRKISTIAKAAGGSVGIAVLGLLVFYGLPKAKKWYHDKRLKKAMEIVKSAGYDVYDEFDDEDIDVSEVEFTEVNPQEEAKDENVKEKKEKK